MPLLALNPLLIALLALAGGWAALRGAGIDLSPAWGLGLVAFSAALAFAIRQVRLCVQTAMWDAGHRVR